MSSYNHRDFEEKWRNFWKEQKTYKTLDNSDKPKYYSLVMFPYPSGDLHVGHWYNFAPADIFARFQRMSGKNVLSPIGFDAFGLPAENAAIKRNIHPSDWTKSNIPSMLKQLDKMGPSYDLDRVIDTSDPEYYKWTQWCFLKLFQKGLAYKAKAAVNWCPVDKSVLANEQAEGGICWRCGSSVEQKYIEQWFFKITDYADRLLEGLEDIKWPEKIKLMQKNWIGKSQGAEINFEIYNQNNEEPSSAQTVTVFTTRPDTIYGATFLVLAPEHPQVQNLTTDKQKKDIEAYIEKTSHKTELDRISDNKEKTGAFTGSYAVHPITGKYLPVWISDFILATYGTGAIMSVPGHDKRDYDFAKEYDLPIKFIFQSSEVTALVVEKSLEKEFFDALESRDFKVEPFSSWGKLIHFERSKISEFQRLVKSNLKDGPWFVHTDGKVRIAIFKDKVISYNTENDTWDQAIEYGKSKKIIPESLEFTFPEEGFEGPILETDNSYLVDSGNFSGLSSSDAKQLIIATLQKDNKGKVATKFKVRDWLVSRQRYWGPPIPIIYCPDCGTVPVPDDELPVILPYEVDYTPKEVSPLGSSEQFVNTKCPKCNKDAKRDTDTIDTFVDSSWYFLRYPTPNAKNFAFGSKLLGDPSDIVNKWLPVDMYIGGAEHAVLHLLYSRFITKVFADMGYLNFQEPFQSLYNQGIILGPDHQKMSKSKGNVINPDDLVEHYGADTVRLYLSFLGPYDQGGSWNPSGIEGAARFIRKFWKLVTVKSSEAESHDVAVAINKLIKKVGQDVPQMKFNTSVAALMECINTISDKQTTREQKETLLKVIAPFCPFLSEEAWSQFGHTQSIHLENWPTFDSQILIEDQVQIVIQINSKVRDRIIVQANSSQEQVLQKAKASDAIGNFLSQKEIINVIFIPNRLLNIVLK